MALQQLLNPKLYAADESRADMAVLRGGRCKCGHVFFPMQHYGCERCGRSGSDLQPVDLTGQGVLAASVTVHLHARPERLAPFTMLTGPVDNLAPGCRMIATLTSVGSTDGALDLRFMAQRQS
jgi:uncharacterized protein